MDRGRSTGARTTLGIRGATVTLASRTNLRQGHVMPTPGGQELIIVLVIILLLFGAKKLPELAGSMGRSIKEFRKAAQTADEDVALDQPSTTAAAPATRAPSDTVS